MARQIHSAEENYLMTRIRQYDDKDAYEALYVRFCLPLIAYAHQFVDSDEAEDIVQNLLSAVWSRRKFINVEKNISSYLFSSVRNACLNHINRSNLRGHILTEMRLSIIDECTDTDFCEYNEIIRLVRESLSELPANQREAFEKSRLYGKSYEEIAKESDVSVKTVEYRISQALKKLRESLQEYIAAIAVCFVTLINTL